MAFKGIGSLRWEVIVQRDSTPSTNTTTWGNTAVMASIETQFSGDEGENGGQVAGSVRYILTMRNEVDVRASDRIAWGEKILRPQSVRMLNLQYLEVLAVEHQ
jgi:hypothetical protein